MFLISIVGLQSNSYAVASFWVSLLVGIPILVATVILPAWKSIRGNWSVTYSLSPYSALLVGDDRKETRRWHVQPGYHTLLLRVQAPTETALENIDVAVLNRRGRKFWKWQYAPINQIQIIGILANPGILPTLEQNRNKPQPIVGWPRFGVGDMGRLGKGESKWFYVTISAKMMWSGRLSFRGRLAGTRRQARLSLAVTETVAEAEKRVRLLSFGPLRTDLHPLAVDEAELRRIDESRPASQ